MSSYGDGRTQRALLFAPHNDDETLFAFYLCLRYQPKVIVVLRSFKQLLAQGGPNFTTREQETQNAMSLAGCDIEQWDWPDGMPSDWHGWPLVSVALEEAVYAAKPETIIYPAWESGGHEEHNVVANILDGMSFEGERIRYMTYVRGRGRSQAFEVPARNGQQEMKEKALACYASQRHHPQTAPWFPGGELYDVREWIKPPTSALAE
jgi:LmbE family N-acetylglucosaminyl deacetylase